MVKVCATHIKVLQRAALPKHVPSNGQVPNQQTASEVQGALKEEQIPGPILDQAGQTLQAGGLGVCISPSQGWL